MAAPRRFLRLIAGLVALAAWAAPALASGPAGTRPWYLDQYGGDDADLRAFYDGHVGVVMRTAPRPMLFISWRLLHGLKVGAATGDALATPCCGAPWWKQDAEGGPWGWVELREKLIGKLENRYIETERQGANDSYAQNCFADAFVLATETLKDRAARYGATSPAVRAWAAGQDAVFANCAKSVALPPLPADAPAWLRKDRAYQEAAAALYDQRWDDAAERFAAIGADPASPWRPRALYLVARTRFRAARALNTPAAYGQARMAIAALKAAPAGTYGQAEATPMAEVMEIREHPRDAIARLERELMAAQPTPRMASQFRDLGIVGDVATPKPEILDWIATLRAEPPEAAGSETDAQIAARYEFGRRSALAHARAVWVQRHDEAWLVAALSLASHGDPQTGELVRAADALPAASPARRSADYHRLRLTLATAPAADTRAPLDTLLARTDLTASERSLFTAQRAQVAASLDDFLHHALRRRLCVEDHQVTEADKPEKPGCVRWRWDNGETVAPDGIYDGNQGLGEDARAVIDRMPLAMRIAVAKSMRLPGRLRLDVALTSFGRAVQLQDNGAIDALANDLVGLLPLLAREFRDVAQTPPGPDKRFAEFLVLAKIPGVRVDLVDYVRPEGERVADFQQYWTDWAILTRPDPGARPPLTFRYQADGAGIPFDIRDAWPDAGADLTCLGECGRGGAPLRLPDFAAAVQAKAAAERGFFFSTAHGYDQPEPKAPAGAVFAWDEMLAYAQSHPKDPRMPEALYWLVHVGRFGGSHDHSGRKAFKLLHARYPGTAWAKRTPYYYD